MYKERPPSAVLYVKREGRPDCKCSHSAHTHTHTAAARMTYVYRAAMPALNLLFLIKNLGPACFMAFVLGALH